MGKIGKCCCGEPECCCVESLTLNIEGYWSATIDLVEVGHSTLVGYTNCTTCTYVPNDAEYEECDDLFGSTIRYLHYNVLETQEFARDWYGPDVFLSGDRWYRGDQVFKDVLYWRDLELEIVLCGNGTMKASLALFASQFLIEGIKVGFEATRKNPSGGCATIYDATEDLGMEDWLPCDGYENIFGNGSGPISPTVPLFPDQVGNRRIQTRSYNYNLVYETELGFVDGDCTDPITVLNNDISISYYWGDPNLVQLTGYTMPTAITDTNNVSGNCFGYTSTVTITYKTALQVNPIVVSLEATINYCA